MLKFPPLRLPSTHRPAASELPFLLALVLAPPLCANPLRDTSCITWTAPSIVPGALVTYYAFDPIAVSATSPETVEFSVQTDGSVTAAVLELASGASHALTDEGGGLYGTSLAHADVLFGYQLDDVNRNFVGFLDLFSGADRLLRGNMFIDVHDASIPDIPIIEVASDMRVSPRVANIHLPGMDPASLDLQQVAMRFYQDFGDDFDFLNIVSTPNRFANRFHFAVQNTVTGIGLGTFDNSSAYGSSGRLLGINRYPIPGLFDLAETGSLHEISHQWINFSDLPELQGITPHWPISSLAPGIIGYQGPSNPQGLAFPFDLIPLGGGDYQLDSVGRQLLFNGMELYLMGMVPPSQAGSYFVFTNQDQTVCDGCILLGPTVDVDADDWIAHEGPRLPAYPDAQVDFRVATIVVSRFRLLTDRELSILDHFAARGEAETDLPFASGFAKGTTLPFKLATQGLGSLDAHLTAPPCMASHGDDFVLSDDTIMTERTFEACNSITVGPNLGVTGPGGHLILRAGNHVILRDGTSIGVDARLTVEIDHALSP